MQFENLDYQKITKYCRQGYFPYTSSKDKQGYVITEQSIISSFKENDLEFTLVTRAEFFLFYNLILNMNLKIMPSINWIELVKIFLLEV